VTLWEQWWPETTAHPRTGPVRLVTGAGTTPYGSEALARECDRVRDAAQGTRNHTLNTAAFRMGTLVAAHELTLDDARSALWQAGLDAGLPDREVESLLRLDTTGALVKGQEAPRAVEDLPPLPVPRSFDDGAQEGEQGPQEGAGQEEAPERSSWYPRDLGPVLRGEVEAPVPTCLTRADGAALFYPGRVNGLLGPSESGKSWLLFLAIAQTLGQGGTVLLLDFEDDPAGAVSRLRTLGVPDEVLADRFRYADPDSTLDALARADLAEVLAEVAPTFVGVDGVNAAMTLLGLDVNSNTDATRFAQVLLRPLARTGAAVGYVDHVAKNAEGRGPGGIGAQAKRAMTDGCAIAVEVVEPFGVGLTGRLRLTVDKDRGGRVRGIAVGARVLGEAVLTSSPDGSHVDLVIEAPSAAEVAVQALDPNREALVWERVSRAVEDVEASGAPPSQRAVLALVRKGGEGGIRDERIRAALDGLVAAGYLAQNGTKGGGYRYRVLRRFREALPGFDEEGEE